MCMCVYACMHTHTHIHTQHTHTHIIYANTGRLGHGNNKDLLMPAKIESIPPMALVRCGDHFSGCVDR